MHPLFRMAIAGTLAWGVYRSLTARMGVSNPEVALQAGYWLVERPARVLALAPHPCDIELFAAGTLLQMADAGSEITLYSATRGENGGARRNLGEIRTREAEKAAAMLRAKQLVLDDFRDGGLGKDDRLVKAIASIWEQTDPEVVLTIDPAAIWPVRRNSDHVALGTATLQAVQTMLSPSTKVLLYAPDHANLLVDTTQVFKRKMEIVRAHRSQMKLPEPLMTAAVASHDALGRGTSPAQFVERFYRLV